jgi:2-polyprenyl-6-methoxyphenol hydroxylase-like FAD-dependent oxidoreductase
MTPSKVQNPTWGTAVVVGGSIGGSAAAAALARHFENVIVLDRDALPEEPAQRIGVPHGYQFHALTVGGSNALEFLLPGITDEFLAHDGHLVDVNNDIVYGAKSGWFPRFPSDLKMYMMTRHAFEAIVRNRAAKLDNVEYRDKAKVTDLVHDGGRVAGVRIGGQEDGETLPADFVVDAAGRGSQAPAWLERAGYPKPVETVVDAKWGYTTTYVRPPEGWSQDFAAFYLGPTISGDGVSRTRGAAIWKQEGGVWVLTAQGCAGDYPPLDKEGMFEFLRSIDDPTLNGILDTFEASAPAKGWRNTANRLRDYVGMARRPEHFLALGDSVAAFNPVYGQGMASAAFAAKLLAEKLAEHSARTPDLAGFADAFYVDYAGIIQNCWTFSTGADNNVPGVEHDGVVQSNGKSPEADYADRVLALATEDPEITRLFRETIQLVRTAEWMAEPALMERVQGDWERLGKLTRARSQGAT